MMRYPNRVNRCNRNGTHNDRIDQLLAELYDSIDKDEDIFFNGRRAAQFEFRFKALALFFDHLKTALPSEVQSVVEKYSRHWLESPSRKRLKDANSARDRLLNKDARFANALMALQFLASNEPWDTCQNGILFEVFLSLRNAGVASSEINDAWTKTVAALRS